MLAKQNKMCFFPPLFLSFLLNCDIPGSEPCLFLAEWLCPNRVLEIPLPLTSSYFSLQQVVLCHQVDANPLLVSGGGFHSSTKLCL